MSYILDADWVIQALAGRPTATNGLRRLLPERITIRWVTVGEVYEGGFNSPNPQAHLDRFRRFLNPFEILDLNEPIIERFAEIEHSCGVVAKSFQTSISSSGRQPFTMI